MKRIDLVEVSISGFNRWTVTLWSGMTMLSEREYVTLAGAFDSIPEEQRDCLSFNSLQLLSASAK